MEGITMARDEPHRPRDKGGEAGPGGFLGGLSNLLEKLTELAEKGQELRASGDLGGAGEKLRGVYGFTIRTGLGGDREGGMKVEPFGNVRRDERTGRTVVHEFREPVVDVFEEADHVLVVAELPGVGAEDVRLSLQDDVLTVTAEHGDKKYRKEVHLPAVPSEGRMSHACHHGVLEIKIGK
jgi:HSP20 family protein